MSKESALQNDIIRLTALLKDSEERNIKHITKTRDIELKFERIKAVQAIARVRANAYAGLLAVDENDPFFSAMLLAYNEIGIFIDKALNTEEDLFELAKKLPSPPAD